jgi:hypothetical protein
MFKHEPLGFKHRNYPLLLFPLTLQPVSEQAQIITGKEPQNLK